MSRHTHIHTYMNVIIVDEKGAMNLKNKEEYREGWRKERERRMKYYNLKNIRNN